MSRVTTHFSHLPIEIYDQIIGMNHDDYQTLANCSLVCRAWSPTCRMHRFRELKVMPRPVGRPLAASLLCDLTSTVLPYVRNLVLVEGLPEMDLDREDRDTITLDPSVGGTTYWFDDVLPEVRTRDLTALESLSLQALQWESLSSSSRSSTVELCRRLRSLDVITWDPLDIPHTAVIQFLSAATALERFTLHLPEQGIIPPINLDELPPPSGADATLALQVFEVHNAVCWYIQTLPRHFSTLHITEATLRGVGRNHVEALIVFLTLCAPTLHRLSLQLEDPYPIWGEVEGMSASLGRTLLHLSRCKCAPRSRYFRGARGSFLCDIPPQHYSGCQTGVHPVDRAADHITASHRLELEDQHGDVCEQACAR